MNAADVTAMAQQVLDLQDERNQLRMRVEQLASLTELARAAKNRTRDRITELEGENATMLPIVAAAVALVRAREDSETVNARFDELRALVATAQSTSPG